MKGWVLSGSESNEKFSEIRLQDVDVIFFRVFFRTLQEGPYFQLLKITSVMKTWANYGHHLFQECGFWCKELRVSFNLEFIGST